MKPTHRTRLVVTAGLVLAGVAVAADVSHRADQQPGTAEQIERGKTAFIACGGCHGAEGEGRVGMGPRLNSPSYLASVSNEFLATTIRDGRAQTNMIPWGASLGEDTVSDLVAFLRSWQTIDGYELDTSPLKGTAEQGAELYQNICSRCHGRSARGYAELGSGSGIGGSAFLGAISDGELRSLIHKGKDNTAMRPFDKDAPTAVANLTDEEIDAIIAYLRANAW
ncbi:MAG: c-type cytochrome [Alphaproteobacteria bacterium]|nr:c-type cytochrome [Alphaproteobacteria bacterium]